MILYHYTNVESARLIGDEGSLVPLEVLDPMTIASVPNSLRPLFGMVWATDLPAPDRNGLGLTSHSIDVDRTAIRYRVLRPAQFVHWGRIRRSVGREIRDGLELANGALPRHWWVAVPEAGGCPVIRDEAAA